MVLDKTNTVYKEQERVKKWGQAVPITEEDFVEFAKEFPYCLINPSPATGPNKRKELILGLKGEESDESYHMYGARKYQDGNWRVKKYAYGSTYYRNVYSKIIAVDNRWPTELLVLYCNKRNNEKFSAKTRKKDEGVYVTYTERISIPNSNIYRTERYVIGFENAKEVKKQLEHDIEEYLDIRKEDYERKVISKDDYVKKQIELNKKNQEKNNEEWPNL